jgi:hypothetical protein
MISHHIYLSVALAHKESQMEAATQLPGRGRREGIRRSTALVSADKTTMTGLLRNMSAEIVGRGAVEYEIALAAGDQHPPCVQARSSHSTRPAARGDEPR